LFHDRTRIRQCVVAHRDRHRGKLVARRAVEMHVALHGDCGAARRGGEAIGWGLAMRAPLFAVSLDIAGAAEKAALAREAHGRHATTPARPAETASAAC